MTKLSIVAIVFGSLLLVGCADSAVSRVVEPAQIEESNARRQEEIDKLNIPEAQKAAMKARLGGKDTPGSDANRTATQ